jgi:deazaflavin-dependent oxidoreductase (nitroreductase family)
MATEQTTARDGFMEWLRRFNKRVTNPIMMTFAGRRIYAVVHHRGRRSGKEYKTPVVAAAISEGFVIPLPYGEHVDWCRNILAAGGCSLQWRGATYQLVAPQIVAPADAMPAFSNWMQGAFRRSKIERFLKLRRAPAQPA